MHMQSFERQMASSGIRYQDHTQAYNAWYFNISQLPNMTRHFFLNWGIYEHCILSLNYFEDYFVETCFKISNMCCIYSKMVCRLCQMASVGAWSHNGDFSSECEKLLFWPLLRVRRKVYMNNAAQSYVLSGHTTKRRIPNSVKYYPITLISNMWST